MSCLTLAHNEAFAWYGVEGWIVYKMIKGILILKSILKDIARERNLEGVDDVF